MPTQSISEARLAAKEARRGTSSVARIEANRANAQKSTGPKSIEGKATVANNAYKHGLRSERNPLDLAVDAALPAEREEFLATLEAFKEDLLPQGAVETRLVERLAQIELRLQRAIRIETTHLEMHTGLLSQSMGKALPTDEQTRHNWLSTLAFLKSPSATTLIAQYESRLSREFARTLTQLRQAQKLRNQTQFTVSASLPKPGQISDAVSGESPDEISAEQTQPQAALSSRGHSSAGVDRNKVADDKNKAAEPAQPSQFVAEQSHFHGQQQARKDLPAAIQS